MSVFPSSPPTAENFPRVNVADRLARLASQMPDAVAVASPGRGDVAGRNCYATCIFRELDEDAAALARGLIELGARPGAPLVLLVPPGVAFVKLVFALLRSGATAVLVDPGMGRRRLVDCLARTQPEGFLAVSRAQAVRTVLRRHFPRATLNVTIGRRWFWGGVTLQQLLARGRQSSASLPVTRGDDPAAVIFTSGSTGPPKGVLYTHRMFDAQVENIEREYDLRRGGADLACFALFGLFNSALGVTTVFPNMNFSRPASADPRKLLAAAHDWRVTQAFASPAVWDNLSRRCEHTGERIPTLRKVFSCGAPVPLPVTRRTLALVHPQAEMHTPYGATEALPVATIEARELFELNPSPTTPAPARDDHASEMDRLTRGVCVGRKFESIDWRIIRIADAPFQSLDDAEELPPGEIGELIVRGPQVTPGYVIDAPDATRAIRPSDSATRNSQLAPRNSPWHPMGDVGYFDAEGRFWYCGRKSQRVETAAGPLFTECVEAVFNRHPAVRRCALVGVGPAGDATPVIVVESNLPELRSQQTGKLRGRRLKAWQQLVSELLHLAAADATTAGIGEFLLHPSLPVDVRHNAKINREELARWALRG